MRRSHDSAALTAALTAAIARFQADVRRLGRTVLRSEIARILAMSEDAGTRARPAPQRGRRRVRTQPTGAGGKRTTAAGGKRKPSAVAGTRAEPVIAVIAEPTIAAEPVIVTIAEPTIVELAFLDPRAEPAMTELAVAGEARPMEPATDEDEVRRERARSRRAERQEARAQRRQWRQERQERARQRRAATGTRGSSPAGHSASTLAGTGTPGVQWSRETIIVELASWMVGGAVVDESFVNRYGPPGLVAAALRVFGRFDVALNVAGQHVARLYPDSPPTR